MKKLKDVPSADLPTAAEIFKMFTDVCAASKWLLIIILKCEYFKWIAKVTVQRSPHFFLCYFIFISQFSILLNLIFALGSTFQNVISRFHCILHPYFFHFNNTDTILR
jgi:hypothetical protein